MGHAHSHPKSKSKRLLTPPNASMHPDMEISQRQDYFKRLGIMKNARARSFCSNTPPPHENGFGLDAKPKRATSFVHALEGKRESGIASLEPPLQRAASDEDDDGIENEMKLVEVKCQDDFRLSYLRKLSYERVWVPEAHRPPKHQTVIIFDWDDTLLCTSYLNQREGQSMHPTIQRCLREIGKKTVALLEAAISMGHTFIITNAMEGWVEHSASKYIPEVLPVLQKVRVISARTKYEVMYPTDVAKWKISAFLDVQRQLDLPIITNLNSFGDSNYEMDAATKMGEEFSQALVKTIKFREHPSPEELMKQLELVIQKFEHIVENARNLKISLERK
mmetsp:Transcript_12622/g.20891  ORF Transcript_12622/g.20891 Transcript_12622/m.20891 type:complete len:335 (+) Transcript_12622:77-1081(+)